MMNKIEMLPIVFAVFIDKLREFDSLKMCRQRRTVRDKKIDSRRSKKTVSHLIQFVMSRSALTMPR